MIEPKSVKSNNAVDYNVSAQDDENDITTLHNANNANSDDESNAWNNANSDGTAAQLIGSSYTLP